VILIIILDYFGTTILSQVIMTFYSA